MSLFRDVNIESSVVVFPELSGTVDYIPIFSHIPYLSQVEYEYACYNKQHYYYHNRCNKGQCLDIMLPKMSVQCPTNIVALLIKR